MSWLETLPGIGDMFKTVRDIIRNFIRDPNDSDRVAAEIMGVFADVLKTEISSQYWLAGNWRPIVMLMIALGLAVKSVMGTMLDASSDYVLFSLLVMGLLGYKLDGSLLKFLSEMFALGKKETKAKKEG